MPMSASESCSSIVFSVRAWHSKGTGRWPDSSADARASSLLSGMERFTHILCDCLDNVTFNVDIEFSPMYLFKVNFYITFKWQPDCGISHTSKINPWQSIKMLQTWLITNSVKQDNPVDFTMSTVRRLADRMWWVLAFTPSYTFPTHIFSLDLPPHIFTLHNSHYMFNITIGHCG